MKVFDTFHPIVLFSYFAAVISLTMFFVHPVYLCITLLLAVALNFSFKRGSFFKEWKLYVPLFFLMAIINPLISHNGELVLFYLNGNAVTVEAIVYGVAIAMMLVAVMLWFSCYNEVMTSDKFLYLFSKISPALALTVSISMRLVPRFTHQLGQIARAQKTIGMDYRTGSLTHRIKCIARILSVLITWALDNAIDTADSMKARGYGIGRRSTFSIFVLEGRDVRMLAVMGVLVAMNIVAGLYGATTFYFYPTFSSVQLDMLSVGFYCSYFVLLAIPLVVEARESLKWRSLKSSV